MGLMRWEAQTMLIYVCSMHFLSSVCVLKAVEERLKTGLSLPDLFQCHGTSDNLVLHQWGEETSVQLRKVGMTTTFHSFPGLYHQLSQPEMELLRSWILNKLPPTTSSWLILVNYIYLSFHVWCWQVLCDGDGDAHPSKCFHIIGQIIGRDSTVFCLMAVICHTCHL